MRVVTLNRGTPNVFREGFSGFAPAGHLLSMEGLKSSFGLYVQLRYTHSHDALRFVEELHCRMIFALSSSRELP